MCRYAGYVGLDCRTGVNVLDMFDWIMIKVLMCWICWFGLLDRHKCTGYVSLDCE